MARVGPVVTSVVAWTTGAATAIVVGLLALSLIGTGLTDDEIQPLTREDIARAAADPPPATPAKPSPAPTGSVSASPTSAGGEQLVSSRGGSVVARCHDGSAYLVYWSPAQGYRTEDVHRGPADMARLTFEGNGREVKISVRCADDVPVTRVDDQVEDDEEHS